MLRSYWALGLEHASVASVARGFTGPCASAASSAPGSTNAPPAIPAATVKNRRAAVIAITGNKVYGTGSGLVCGHGLYGQNS